MSEHPHRPNQPAPDTDQATSEAVPDARPADDRKDRPHSEPARVKKSPARQRRESAKKSAAARWGKKP